MSDLSHARPDIAGHPDVAEMRERYARMAGARQAVALDGLILLTGLYTAISPWVVHFHALPDITVNNLIVGITIAVIGLGMTLAGEKLLRLSWTVAAMGVWLIISPWVVTAGHGAPAGVIWNNCWIGGVACALGLAAMAMMRTAGRPTATK
ncbi:SPW repeat protein [Streptomyces guryensis]|uniref:SPW repeat protein n=1 Tax=Streptomyces guryensis TaxID=2886947 RepID=A0A9Q3Z917_9ACTN|nr:SPW repeat protein [Streptomyces guryensis]MCD9879208.1 SPW repeat protein [Streptomyces guryensis]